MDSIRKSNFFIVSLFFFISLFADEIVDLAKEAVGCSQDPVEKAKIIDSVVRFAYADFSCLSKVLISF